MSGPTPARKPTDPLVWMGRTNDRTAALSEYFEAGADRYTPDALRRAATESGFSPMEVQEAYARAAERRRAAEVTRPIRRRARWIVLAAYGLTYLAFAVAFLGDGINQYSFEIGGLVVLAMVLGVALFPSLRWARSRGSTLLAMLVVPFVLLVAISGLCFASTGPTYFGLGV